MNLRLIVVVALASAACSTVASSAIAQDPAWLEKNYHQNPSRYEGLLDEPNARREYDVLSFLAVAAPKAPTLTKELPPKLRLQFCRPSVDPGIPARRQPAFIEVRQLTGHINYLMKAADDAPSPPLNNALGLSTFDWPTSDVIRRYSIDPNNLGVVIHLGRDNEYSNTIAPAIFTSVSAAPSTFVDHYELILRIQQSSLDSLSYQVRPSVGPPIQCYYLNDFHPCESSAPTTQPVIEEGSVVNLRFAIPSSQQGPAILHIEGRHHNSDLKLEATFRFLYEQVCR